MNNFKRNIYKTGVSFCNLSPLTVVTTDPTNLEGNNGTATVSYSGNQGGVSYSLNGGVFIQITTPNTFTITGLSASTQYTIVVKEDSDGTCQKEVTFQLGVSSFYFDADYIMITYQFTDGRDLDTKTRMVYPNIGQVDASKYLGFLGGNIVFQYPPTLTTPILKFGGDNQGTGFESVLIDINNFKRLYPGETSFTVDCRCLWFRPLEVGVQPVTVAARLWKGGTPVQDGCFSAPRYFCWTNITKIDQRDLNSVPKLITSTEKTSGQRAATLTYNLLTKTGILDNNDSTTPFV